MNTSSYRYSNFNPYQNYHYDYGYNNTNSSSNYYKNLNDPLYRDFTSTRQDYEYSKSKRFVDIDDDIYYNYRKNYFINDYDSLPSSDYPGVFCYICNLYYINNREHYNAICENPCLLEDHGVMFADFSYSYSEMNPSRDQNFRNSNANYTPFQVSKINSNFDFERKRNYSMYDNNNIYTNQNKLNETNENTQNDNLDKSKNSKNSALLESILNLINGLISELENKNKNVTNSKEKNVNDELKQTLVTLKEEVNKNSDNKSELLSLLSKLLKIQESIKNSNQTNSKTNSNNNNNINNDNNDKNSNIDKNIGKTNENNVKNPNNSKELGNTNNNKSIIDKSIINENLNEDKNTNNNKKSNLNSNGDGEGEEIFEDEVNEPDSNNYYKKIQQQDGEAGLEEENSNQTSKNNLNLPKLKDLKKLTGKELSQLKEKFEDICSKKSDLNSTKNSKGTKDMSTLRDKNKSITTEGSNQYKSNYRKCPHNYEYFYGNKFPEKKLKW